MLIDYQPETKTSAKRINPINERACKNVQDDKKLFTKKQFAENIKILLERTSCL